jgi:hypothetical protein
MKKLLCIAVIACSFGSKSFAVTQNELQDLADCIAAFEITNANMKLNGDHKNYKVGSAVSSKLFDIFYDKLALYKRKNPSIDEAYWGQLPNRSLAGYGYMNDLQQLKYAQSVMNTNNCFQYAR